MSTTHPEIKRSLSFSFWSPVFVESQLFKQRCGTVLASGHLYPAWRAEDERVESDLVSPHKRPQMTYSCRAFKDTDDNQKDKCDWLWHGSNTGPTVLWSLWPGSSKRAVDLWTSLWEPQTKALFILKQKTPALFPLSQAAPVESGESMLTVGRTGAQSGISSAGMWNYISELPDRCIFSSFL